MQKLDRGIHAFQAGYFANHQQLFEQLATAGQSPETLFVTCCDSRVVPTLITQAAPGELFIVRNIGNIIPGPDLPGGTSAAIEYAVEVLKIENIIVCGHTQCGAMEAGRLHVSGWIYRIGRGEIYDYDPSAGEFTLLAGEGTERPPKHSVSTKA